MRLPIATPKLEALGHRVAGELCLRAYEEEELTHLGLEDDDQRDNADADDAAEYLCAETHVEEVGELPSDINDHDGPENAYDIGATNQPVELEHQDGNQQNI